MDLMGFYLLSIDFVVWIWPNCVHGSSSVATFLGRKFAQSWPLPRRTNLWLGKNWIFGYVGIMTLSCFLRCWKYVKPISARLKAKVPRHSLWPREFRSFSGPGGFCLGGGLHIYVLYIHSFFTYIYRYIYINIYIYIYSIQYIWIHNHRCMFLGVTPTDWPLDVICVGPFQCWRETTPSAAPPG